MAASKPRAHGLAPTSAIGLGAILLASAPVAITLLAALLRLTSLATQPGGLYPDEGAEALDAHRLLHEPGFHPVFFDDDAGREALYGYLVAAAFWLRGESVIVLRGTSAVLGVLGVVALYLALRRFGRPAALAGMAWVAGSLWLICVSRDGMRNVLVPLFGALMLWALVRWADHPGRWVAAAAGAVVGAGLWTYQPLKLAPLLVALWILWLRHVDRPRYLSLRRHLGWFALAFVVVAAPMLVTAILNPNGYFGRAVGVSPLNPDNAHIGVLEHTLRTLGMFAVTGDPNQRHDVASLPLLGWPLFLLALLGAARAWRRRGDAGHALLLLGIPGMLIPPLVGIDGGTPHFLRSLGLAPFIAGLIGLGCVAAADGAGRLWPRAWARPAAAAALAVLLFALGAGSASAYFSRPERERFRAYSFDVVQLAAAAGPRSAVVIDGYNEIDVRFLDAGGLPAIYHPGQRVSDPGRFVTVLALRKNDLGAALGSAAAERAAPVDRDPQGNVSVWGVRP